ncbi:hypothetical protein ABZ353_10620 [Streptomyces niveus]|uniref:hypothetical protein n=1 Tax=Streptomyces niveus TaxID=193462 RepID=UPI003402A3A5
MDDELRDKLTAEVAYTIRVGGNITVKAAIDLACLAGQLLGLDVESLKEEKW